MDMVFRAWVNILNCRDEVIPPSAVMGVELEHLCAAIGLLRRIASRSLGGTRASDLLRRSQTSPDGTPRRCVSPRTAHSLKCMDQALWAEELARKLLEIPLPHRWAHVQGVAAQAWSLAPILGDDAELLESAAWLHDIGYSPDLADTGFHPLDGARYLRDVHAADSNLCRLVANHSCAVIEAEEWGLGRQLSAEFPASHPNLNDALAYCDMTTTPTGRLVSVHDRLSEIRQRYGPSNVVTRFTHEAEPNLVASVARTTSRLNAHHLRASTSQTTHRSRARPTQAAT